jgi:hypothetical protein
MYQYCSGRCWARPSYTGSICSTEHHAILVLPMDFTIAEPHCRCGPKVVHLRVALGVKLLQALPGYRVAFHLDGHCTWLSRSSLDAIRVQPAEGELGLQLPTKEVLGQRHSCALLFSGRLEYHHRCGLHGSATNLSIKGTALQKDPTRHSHCLPSQYTVSTLSITNFMNY